MVKLQQILVVDDELEVLEVLKELFEDTVESVLTAINGEEALKILSEKQVDCIVSDINMAPVNGAELLRRLNQAQKNNISFIFYTAHGSEVHLKGIDLKKVTAIVAKPSFDNLEKEIFKIIESKKN